jgi:hypothetical protein
VAKKEEKAEKKSAKKTRKGRNEGCATTIVPGLASGRSDPTRQPGFLLVPLASSSFVSA